MRDPAVRSSERCRLARQINCGLRTAAALIGHRESCRVTHRHRISCGIRAFSIIMDRVTANCQVKHVVVGPTLPPWYYQRALNNGWK